MAEPLPKPWTVDEFLAWESAQEERHEFIDGVVVGMAGGTAAHATIRDNLTVALHAGLRGSPCRAFSETLRVVTPRGSYYPDIVVSCKPVRPTDEQIAEPVLIVEVLSRSTADRDRGAKWVGYQDIPSLQHYVLVAQDHRRVDRFTRTADGWALTIIRPPTQQFALAALDLELSLDQLYEGSEI
jgi:Uma2 family endonuclease